ncbi:MAG: hypothetical protein JO144_10500 [Actinobacteria bacterium]|nr:hypothetical protein [Actinomycetota bacterium]
MTDPMGIRIDREHILWPLFCPRPVVRILFYTDRPDVVSPGEDFSTTTLRDWIQAANNFYADFQIDIVNRFAGASTVNGVVHATSTLTAQFLAGYDQVWFFGVNQCNLPGQPDNELSDSEVAVLHDWMRTGGVLMTGDHANPNPSPGNGLDALLNLGRALGHRVPRAGQLRKWEGLPSADTGLVAAGEPMGPRANHNTQQPDPPLGIDTLGPQSDAIPQPLHLAKYPLWSFRPWERRERPHPLFCGRTGPIEVFPDHMHEGMLTLPAAGAPDWPAGGVGPEVIATGRDTRTGRVWPVVSAYDGHPGGVGRIVADSTWHHYFHINLTGFAPGSSARQRISEYYVNLAVWLSPPAKRQAMRCWALWFLYRHPAVQEVTLQSPWTVGGEAFDVLGRTSGPCTLIDLIISWPRYVQQEHRWPWPPEELLLGGILSEYQLAAASGERIESRHALRRRGIERAVQEQRQGFERGLKETTALMDQLAEVLGFAEEGTAG